MPKTPLTGIDNLKRALVIAEQIERLEAELVAVLGGSTVVAEAPLPAKKRSNGKRSAEVRAKMAAAQKARWAGKKKTGVVSPSVAAPSAEAKPLKKKRRLSAEGRARIVAALKARHAAAAKEKSNTAKSAPAKPAPASKAKRTPWYAK
jgi:hypothetical protein